MITAGLLITVVAVSVGQVAPPLAPADGAQAGGAPSSVGAVDPGTRSVQVLNDNGGWSWFQDERALFTRDGRLMVASVPDGTGTGGRAREGGTDVTTVDARSGAVRTDRLFSNLPSDDHNAAALLELPGRTLALATSHSSDPSIYRAHLEADATRWEEDAPIFRPEAAADDPGLGRRSGVTYSNLAFLSEENGGRGRVYDIYRGEGENQHLMTSDDEGRTWTDRGRLFRGYRAYLKIASDGKSRIWFTLTDSHPDAFDGTSLYAGYIEDDAVHRSDGTVVAPLGRAVAPDQLTPVVAGTPGSQDVEVDAWISDMALDPFGRPIITYSATLPGPAPRPHRYRRHDAGYARWDGTTWQQHRMGGGGTEVGDQIHYTGLSAIDPGDPDRVFLSTDVHPATGALLVSGTDRQVHHEIFEGRTGDGGATWAWVAVTADSTEDNLRPIVPTPRDGASALLWLRGSYRSGLVFDLDVVGILDPGRPAASPPASSSAGR